MRSEKPLIRHADVHVHRQMSRAARIETGYLLKKVQRGHKLSRSVCRAARRVGKDCFELIVKTRHTTWRVIYRDSADAVIVLAIYSLSQGRTPRRVVELAKRRLAELSAVRFDWVS